MCGCKFLSKLILIIVNLVLLLAGMLMLAFGITAKVKPDLVIKLFAFVPSMDQVPQAFDLAGIINGSAIFMIVLGSIVTAVGFFGCFGACCENQCMLITYVVVVAVVLAAEIALIIYAAVSPKELKTFIQKVMNESLSNVNDDANMPYGVLQLPKNEVSLGWAVLQIEAQCCGTYNYTDYTRIHSVNVSGTNYNTPIPLSCCATKTLVDLKKNVTQSDFQDIPQCLGASNPTYINNKNCYDAVYEMIQKSSAIAIGIAAGIAGLLVILIIAGICLCRASDKD